MTTSGHNGTVTYSSNDIHVHTSFESHDKTSAGVSFKNVNSYIMPADSGTKPKM